MRADVGDVGDPVRGRDHVELPIQVVWRDRRDPGINEASPLAQYKGKDAMAETQQTLRADIENLYGPLKALSEAEAHKQFGKNVTIVRPRQRALAARRRGQGRACAPEGPGAEGALVHRAPTTQDGTARAPKCGARFPCLNPRR